MFKVLIVEDQQTAAEALAKYVERMPGFEIIGQASNGTDALQRLATEKVDLLLLDIYLPDMSGLEMLRRIRAAGNPVDVIAVTQARDISVVRAVVSFGAMQYLVKPFTFAAVRKKLEQYQTYRSMLADNEQVVAQEDIDHFLQTLRGSAADALPRGISSESLHSVRVGAATGRRRHRHVRRAGRELLGRFPRHSKAIPRIPRRIRRGRTQDAIPGCWSSRGRIPAAAPWRGRRSPVRTIASCRRRTGR